MGVMLDMRVVQLLYSRLCHDLVGPVGAVNNGLELAGEMGGAFDSEAMDLVRSSARQATDRLQFFRIAFGLALGAVKTNRDVKALLTPAVIGEKNELIWPEEELEGDWALGDQSVKLFLNMVHLAGECVPRGGEIEIFIEPEDGGAKITVTSAGQGARVEETVLEALLGRTAIEELTPRSAIGYLIAQLAIMSGGAMSVDYPREDMVAIRAYVRNEPA